MKFSFSHSSETPMIASPMTAAESTFIRRSPSCNSQLLRSEGGATSQTNHCVKRDSWDFTNHKPRNSLPCSLSYQHMATIPRKSQGQQNPTATGKGLSSGLKTPSTKTVTFDITPSTHPYVSRRSHTSAVRDRSGVPHSFWRLQNANERTSELDCLKRRVIFFL